MGSRKRENKPVIIKALSGLPLRPAGAHELKPVLGDAWGIQPELRPAGAHELKHKRAVCRICFPRCAPQGRMN